MLLTLNGYSVRKTINNKTNSFRWYVWFGILSMEQKIHWFVWFQCSIETGITFWWTSFLPFTTMHNTCVHESVLLRLLLVNGQTLNIASMTSPFLWLLYGLWKADYQAKNFWFTYVSTATLYYNMVVSSCQRCRIVCGCVVLN